MRPDRRSRSAVLFAAGAAALLLGAPPAPAQTHGPPAAYQQQWLTREPGDPSEAWLVAFGGRAYDNWAAVQGKALPFDTHPSYPAAGKQKGNVTWRCKECHGWDYKGVEGAYGAQGAARFTGVKGIRALAGGDPQKVIAIIRDATHRYTEAMLPPVVAERLALFVTKGQLDTDRWIDGAKKVKGDAQKGRAGFQNLCAVCHGYDGRELNFGSTAEPQYLGTIATGNPWELLHKARNGHAGEPMPANLWMDMQVIADIGAYAQLLPVK